MTEGIASSEQAKRYFNTIDKVHEILESDKDLASDVPSCVVVGMQSAGKSSVLSRISGIPFPRDSALCTRVAIELRLRRALVMDGDSDDNLRTTLLIKAGDMSDIEIEKTNKTGIENALVKAQKDVLDGKDFEDKKSVKVEKEDKDIPDVTLIDLPGVFFAKNPEDEYLERQVQEMIKERVQNHMAMILHIVPLNQDTDTLSTWRTVLEADPEQERTICILTKADLALSDDKDALKKRLRKISSDLKGCSSFIVHGSLSETQDELDELKFVTECIHELDLNNKFAVGISKVNECIEEKMLQHIKETIPELRKREI